MRQAQPGHYFPHHWMTDAHTMRAFQPRPQFAQFRVGPRFDLLAHGAHQRLKPKRHMVVLRSRRDVAMPTLVALYPNKAPLIEASMLRISILVSAQEGARGAGAAAARLAQGVAVGKLAAALVLAAREFDGSTLVNDPSKCLPTVPGQPDNTVLPAPLCWERYFPGTVPQPTDPLKWTMDPISGQTLQLGATWGSVQPFVLAMHQFTPSSGVTLGGTTMPLPTAADPGFKASLDDGAYGPTIPDPQGGATPISSRYGVRAFGGWNPAPGTPVPSGGGPRAITTTERTDAQTIEGNFWGYDATALLCAPPRLYNMIATSIYLDHVKPEADDHTAVEGARYLALVNLALADAGIAAWDGKFAYMIARPVTFIRNHPTDPQHPDDDIWTPLGQVGSNGALPNVTPPFPAYPSGHAVFGGAAFTIIGKALNLDKNTNASAFDFVSDEYNGHTFGSDGRLRPMLKVHFASLKSAEWENAESRVFLGIHWQRDADDGSALGDEIADTIYAETLKPIP